MKEARRGFGAMDPEKLKEIARSGGKKAHELGHANKLTPEKAKIAGRKGGRYIAETRGREYMSMLGRRGGEARAKKLLAKAQGLSDQLLNGQEHSPTVKDIDQD